MLSDKTTAEELVANKAKVRKAGVQFFETPMVKYQLDAIPSIKQYNHAAAANYPCLTIPMVTKQQENHGTYLYSQTLSRRCPFKMGFAFEKQPKPENYQTTINR
jgi:amidase